MKSAAAPAADPGFALYVHWPFCLAKCPYCDFNSHVRGAAIDEERYVAAFRTEIRHRAQLAPGRTVRSIFFGGGTPSLMRPQTVQAIVDAVGGGLDDRARRGDHARGQSDQRRGRALPRLSRGRRQPGVARRPGAERRRPEIPRPRAIRSREALAASKVAASDLLAPFVRSDLRPPRPERRRLARRACPGDGARLASISRSTN